MAECDWSFHGNVGISMPKLLDFKNKVHYLNRNTMAIWADLYSLAIEN